MRNTLNNKEFQSKIQEINDPSIDRHNTAWQYLSTFLNDQGFQSQNLLEKISAFNVAIPSWALGTGGTRFGHFSGAGEPRDLAEKIEDAGLLKGLSQATNSISLHIPWDIPKNPAETKALAAEFGLSFDTVNSNTFQDQPDQDFSYKYGSLSHTDKVVREQAIEHNLEVINYGQELGSKAITIWLADGSCFPGQQDFRRAFERTSYSLRKIHDKLPGGWRMFTEHKPYEPNFYSTVVADWGSSLLLAQQAGEKCHCLVDLGHHLPNTNIEQIVSRLLMVDRLGGFHFNDSKYGDDDLTAGCIKPYQLFLIFNELTPFMNPDNSHNPSLCWMIDASHNVKDPIEDILQSLDAIRTAYAQALLVDRKSLAAAQESNDAVAAQELLQRAYRTDVRPLLAEARRLAGGALDPITAFRDLNIRSTLINTRGKGTSAAGL